MRSTFFRIFISMVILLFASFTILASSFATLAFRFNNEEREAALERNADIIVSALESNILNGRIHVNQIIRYLLRFSAEFSGYHVVLVGLNGSIVATSDYPEVMSSETLWVGREQVQQTLMNGRYADTGTLGGLYSSEYYSVGKPVAGSDGRVAGAIFVSSSIKNFGNMLTGFIRLFFTASATVLLTAWVFAYLSAQKMSSPLKATAAAAREFARGNLSVRVDENLPDTELKELASSFNNMAQALEQTEERRRDFIANISHELKTPMTSIGGYVDGILDGVIPEERQDASLRVVSAEIKRLSRLVSDMLEIGRVEGETPLVKERFDLCEIARLTLIGQEKRIDEKRLNIEVDFDDAVEVIADKDSIIRVIYNLLDNAVKYSYENTSLGISITQRASKAVFRISDEGPPIPPDERELIFERFHKTDRSRKSDGLGLGLYLVKSIMARHNEDVWCEGEGNMTTMCFTLPLAPSVIEITAPDSLGADI